MSFHLAVCCPNPERSIAVCNLCREYFHARRDACRVVSFSDFEALLADPIDYDAYILPVTPPAKGQPLPEGLLVAQKLRARGMCSPIIFAATSPKWAYEAFRVDALQYLPSPLTREALFPVLDRAVEPEYGPVFPLRTVNGIYGIPFAEIESVECTDHVLHFHRLHRPPLSSVTLRIPLNQAIAPLLTDRRFLQPHRSYVINLSAVARICTTEFEMQSGGRIPIPRGRYPKLKAEYLAYLAQTHGACDNL